MALNNTRSEGLSSPRSRLIYVEVLVFLGVTALFLLVILGAYRRRSSSKVVQLIIWASYAVSYSLVSYTLGLIQSSPYGNGLFSVWASSLFMFFGSADSISAYSLEDNDNWKRFYVHQLIQAFWIGWILASFTEHSDFKIRLWAIYTIIVLKSSTRIVSFQWASNTGKFFESTKFIADYMSNEHEQHRERNPVTMRGYRYVVAGEDNIRRVAPPPNYMWTYRNLDDRKLITVEQIWECNGSLLLGEHGEQLKDLCLSLALSKMLNRRFAGFQLTKSELHNMHEFLFDGLLHGNSYCERAFRIIEVELAFVHDYFYTKYSTIYSLFHIDIIMSLIMIPFCISLAYRLWRHFLMPNDGLNLLTSRNRNYDALVTFVIVIGMTLVEVFQVYLYLASGWCKVALISSYVVRASWQSNTLIAKSIGYIVSLKSFRCWEESLGQYTLLRDFDYKPRLVNTLHYLTLTLVDKRRKGQKKGKSIRLSRDIKEAVLESLKRSNGQLTKGVTSLQRNNMYYQLLGACSLPTTTHTILAWHIATTICEEDNMGTNIHSSHASIACTLSKYCAYLVVFAPSLLPDHSSVSQTIFDALVWEATQLLQGGVMTPAQRCHRLMNAADADPQGDRLIIRGARLGAQLTRTI